MCPEKAKVFIAEDDEDWRRLNREAVEKAGHKVVIEVKDVRTGLAEVSNAQKLGVQAALLDGRIPSDPSDGPTLAAALRQAIPGIKVVDVSAWGDTIKNADAKMPKTKFNPDRLGKLITEF